MRPDILALICATTHDALEIEAESDGRDHRREFLVNPRTGRRFPIRDSIPILLKDAEVSGSNKKYQALYDRFAPFYDFSMWLYSRWKSRWARAAICNSCRVPRASLGSTSRGEC